MSGDAADLSVNLSEVLDPTSTGDAGVPNGRELLALANAFHLDRSALEPARRAVERMLGREGLVESVATISVFAGLVRVADGTGIQLDDGVMIASADYREELGLNRFLGASNTPGEPAVRSASASESPIRDLFA